MYIHIYLYVPFSIQDPLNTHTHYIPPRWWGVNEYSCEQLYWQHHSIWRLSQGFCDLLAYSVI